MRYKEFIVYGKHIDKSEFNEPKTGHLRYLNKPDGGLWCSPVGSRDSWRSWCEAEDFPINLEKYTKFTVTPDIRVLEINSLVDLEVAIKRYGLSLGYSPYCLEHLVLDWDKIKQEYDGVFLSESGNRECHLPSIPGIWCDLNSWDCESMVLMNLDHIKITEIYG